jgi:hypothetical protein
MPDHNAFLKTASIRFVPRDANRASHFGFALINDQCALLWNLEGAQRVPLRVEIDIEDDQILVFGLRRERRHDRLLRPAFCAPRRGDMHQNGFARFERGLKRLGLVGEAIRGQGVDGGQQQDCRGEEKTTGLHTTGSLRVDGDCDCERASSGAKCANGSFATSRASRGAVMLR